MDVWLVGCSIGGNMVVMGVYWYGVFMVDEVIGFLKNYLVKCDEVVVEGVVLLKDVL